MLRLLVRCGAAWLWRSAAVLCRPQPVDDTARTAARHGAKLIVRPPVDLEISDYNLVLMNPVNEETQDVTDGHARVVCGMWTDRAELGWLRSEAPPEGRGCDGVQAVAQVDAVQGWRVGAEECVYCVRQ